MSITLQTVSSGYNLSAINTNFQSLQTALNNSILWRTGSIAGEAKMSRDLDMDGNAILNAGVDLDNPGSLLTLEVADARYYNITGDVLEGDLNAGQHRLTNLDIPLAPFDATRKQELDSEIGSRQSADANIQAQLTGNVPLEASAFSPISWHDPDISNSVNIPANKNAWSFGPQIEIEVGQAVTIGAASSWTIANGRVVEDEDLHNLIADTIRTSDGSVTVDVTTVLDGSSLVPINNRLTALESEVQPLNRGGTGATTAASARTALGAASSGANTDITSITGSAASLTTSRTFQTNLGSTSTASFNGTANVTPGVTGTLPVANGGTGATSALAARTALGAVGNLINIQVFTASGTYTATAGTSSVVIELVGGGGQGGGCAATTSGTSAAGAPGGGGGAYIKHRLTSGFSGTVVTIGSGGSGGAAGAAGNAGSASTFGAILTAGGGAGGSLGGAGTAGFTGGAAGGTPTGGNILSTAGMAGAPGQVFTVSLSLGGAGGANNLLPAAGGVVKLNSGTGIAATQYGGGGSGASNTGTQSAAAGGAGFAGVCIIYEYA